MKRSTALLLVIIALLLPACGARAATQGVSSPGVGALAPTEPPTDTFQVLNHWPHDPSAYTEGLIYADGAFFESTGLNGMSSIRKVDAETGQVIASLPLDATDDAEVHDGDHRHLWVRHLRERIPHLGKE
ncbi:MAG: glutaminyl-peptide cyclotransferase [Thermomicrobia bacterium]|nr:glutaminyl-peptide cyclotransferase [Thermomicrobia bacterium]